MSTSRALVPCGSTGSRRGHPRVSRLDTLVACRRELARLYREARTGTLDTQEATRLTFIVMNIARLIEGGELERRLAALEQTRIADVEQ